jgi:hypothetical protein
MMMPPPVDDEPAGDVPPAGAPADASPDEPADPEELLVAGVPADEQAPTTPSVISAMAKVRAIADHRRDETTRRDQLGT